MTFVRYRGSHTNPFVFFLIFLTNNTLGDSNYRLQG